jgi:hypothetical protein
MKRLFLVLALFLVSGTASAHNVVLVWNASTDTGVAYNVYRAAATLGTGNTVTCPSVPFADVLATGLTVLTYTDATVALDGAYCYYVTATLGGLESIPSNLASAVILPSAPTGLTTVIH